VDKDDSFSDHSITSARFIFSEALINQQKNNI